MKPQKITYHVSTDRMDRAIAILEKIGLGEEFMTVEWTDTTGRLCLRTLTTTGVILCKNIKTQAVTTLFVASFQQAEAICGKCPPSLRSIIKKNQIRFKDLM